MVYQLDSIMQGNCVGYTSRLWENLCNLEKLPVPVFISCYVTLMVEKLANNILFSEIQVDLVLRQLQFF